MNLFKFTPYLHNVIWGGDKIGSFKGVDLPAATIGESWEISSYPEKESIVKDGPHKGLTLSQLIAKYQADLVGRHIYARFGNEFPLIVKFIDAKDDLSVQVHPSQQLEELDPQVKSKTELWYTVDADPGSKIYAGFCKKLDPANLREVCSDPRILDYLSTHLSKPGKAYFLPGGCPHAIGAGNFILEIQQCSNTTYRIYDFDRLDSDGKARELHIDQAASALNFNVESKSLSTYPEPSDNHISLIKDCPFFTVGKANVDGFCTIQMPHDSFIIIVGVEGQMTCHADDHSITLDRGETILVSAATTSLKLTGKGTAILAHA